VSLERFGVALEHECNRMLKCIISEQLLEGGLVRPKHVAVECDFNGILK
jgi:hypothetical protein